MDGLFNKWINKKMIKVCKCSQASAFDYCLVCSTISTRRGDTRSERVSYCVYRLTYDRRSSPPILRATPATLAWYTFSLYINMLVKWKICEIRKTEVHKTKLPLSVYTSSRRYNTWRKFKVIYGPMYKFYEQIYSRSFTHSWFRKNGQFLSYPETRVTLRLSREGFGRPEQRCRVRW